MTTQPPTLPPGEVIVLVRDIRVAGQAVHGRFPLVRDEGHSVIVRHPKIGLLRAPKANVEFPDAQPAVLTYEELVRDIRARFDTLTDLVSGVIAGHVRSLLVSGAPGVGKSFTAETMFQMAMSEKRLKSYEVVRGTISPIGLYILLWENRNKGQVIFLDDADAALADETSLNLIKAATDSAKTRRVSYMKEALVLKDQGIPNTFEYKGAIVVATNIRFDNEAEQKTKLGAHLSAVVSRSLYLDLGLHSKQALLARIEDVVRHTDMLADEGLTPDQIDVAMGWLKDNAANVRSLSLRSAMQLAGLMLAHPDKWKQIAKATMLKPTRR